jgi:hypothetical protein
MTGFGSASGATAAASHIEVTHTDRTSSSTSRSLAMRHSNRIEINTLLDIKFDTWNF